MIPSVLVLGGYGLFGKRVCALLLRHTDASVIVAGRDLETANAFRTQLDPARTHALAIDTTAADFATRLQQCQAEFSTRIVIHCAGPFQSQDYRVAKAAIAAGVHYIDLADGREFVQGISALDKDARLAGVCVISGASSVPALSSAVIAQLAKNLTITDIDIGISPGNRTERGLATMRAILSYCGARIPAWRNGKSGHAYGWQNLRRHRYAKPAGSRWLCDCDVPDLALLPNIYPELRQLRFGAGLELSFLHLGLYALAALRRLGLLPNLARFAAPMKTISEWFIRGGSDIGAMHVRVTGYDTNHHVHQREWQLIAENGDGPNVPAAASVAITKLLLSTGLQAYGASTALQVLTLQQILDVLAKLHIRTLSSDLCD